MKKKELISMVAFVGKKAKQGVQAGRLYNKRQTDILFEIYNYRTFLNLKLNISMFVPAIFEGGKWVVLEYAHPKPTEDVEGYDKYVQYQTALDNVIFEGFEVDGKFISHSQFSYLIDRLHYSTIQDLIKYKPTLTPRGMKESGIN